MELVAENNAFSEFPVFSHPYIAHLIVLEYLKDVFWAVGCFLLFIESAYVMQWYKGGLSFQREV